ncbi:TonB-dependent receptor [Phenylobacterium sp.]|jgi:iron complex outermembrane receptor protein|uniref:TonB-dependent receptor n=1 Tax=Phenylobacterium sp. TaxID=1871053 RepID=UPI002F91C59F
MNFRRRLLAMTALVSASLTATAALAQDESSNTIEELVVTAEKREQSLQDVPVAITAFTDERREVLGITNAQELTNFTPGLSYNTGNDRLTMRGIGRLTNNRASEGGVAMYVDNFYTSSVYSASRSSLFIDRTEVLRGPQGTLYGRNAIGGAMNFIAKRPTDEFYAEVRGQIANYDTRQFEFAMSGPILGEALRGRIGGSWFEQGEGFYKNVAGGPSEGGRGTVYDIDAQLDGELFEGKFDWWARYQKFNTDALGRGAGGRQGVTVGVTPTAQQLFLASASTPTAAYANFNNTSPLASSLCDRCFEADTPNQIDIDSETFILHANLHLDGFDVRYVGGRTWYDYRLQTDVDGTARSAPINITRATPNVITPSACNPTGLPYLSTPNAAGVCSAPSFFVPAAGTTLYPRLVNLYNEEPTWFSNELNFASTGDGPAQWLLGLYQFREESNYTPIDARAPDDPFFGAPRVATTGLPAAPNADRAYAVATSKTRSNSYAIFGQTDWELGEQFVLHAGLRYTWDSKTVVEGARLICRTAPSPACPAAVTNLTGGAALDFTRLAVGTSTLQPATLPNGQPNPNAGKPVDPSQIVNPTFDPTTGFVYRVLQSDWSGWGGTLGLDWKPDTDTLVYAKYSRGYKAGGFNSATTTLSPSVTTDSEKIDAFEVGAKKTFMGNLQANASAFYYAYKDIQAVMSTPDPILGTNQALYVNFPEATIWGFELETIWQPIDNLQLNVTYAYLDATVDDAGCNKATGLGCYQDPDRPTLGLQDLSGATLGASTPHRVAFNANYTIQDLVGGDLTLSGSYVWRSETYYSVFNTKENRAKAWDQVDLRALWNQQDGNVTVIGYVKNVFDENGQVGAGASRITSPGPLNGFVNQSLSYIPPRQFGVEVQYRF